MKKLLMLFFLFCGLLLPVSGQQKTISGTVTGAEDNLPLAGVTVLVKGTTVGVLSDINGKYQINAEAGSTLEFRYVGMKTIEVVVGTASVYDITLETDAIGLDEIVVTGYGTQIKSKVSSSISKVDGESLRNLPVASVELALQGKSAGVFVESLNGKATGSTRMRIRGSSSVTASNEPLYVVDGIPLTTETVNQSGASINPLSTFNFNDVESVEILKDAASAAIFGSRGANGVVLITTKKGVSGATKLNFNIQSGISEASNRREFLNAEQFVQYFEEAAYNSDLYEGYDPINNPDDYSGSWLQFARTRFNRYDGWATYTDPELAVNTDWQEQAFQTGNLLAADFSAQGGNDKLKFFASGSYSNQEGILVSNGIQKISGRLNIDNKVNNYMDLGMALSLTKTIIDQVSADNAFSTPMQLVALSPITPVRDLDGKLYNVPVTTYYNGLIDVEEATRDISNFRTLVNTYMNFNLHKSLKWRNEFGFDLYSTKENARYGERTDSGQGTNGYGFANYGENQNINAKSLLDYNNTFGNFGVTAVLGTEYQYTVIDNAWAEGEQFPLDDLKTLASAGLISGASSSKTEYSFISYFTRVNLDYKAKYLLTFAGRIDGSSRFGENSRYGTFPAASVGWVLTKESFLTGNPIISFLKLRASFGQTGNAGIGNFRHLGLYGVDNYYGTSGLIPTQIANDDLGWETTKQYDLGIDYGFFKNRISGEIDYYVKNTSDLLLDVPVPSTTGYTVQTQNVGSVSNKGIEFVINTTNLTGEFEWTTNLNLSYNVNEVTNLGEQTIIDEGSSRFMNVVMVGKPLGVFYGAEYAGVDPDNGDAIWYVNEKDENGNVIDHTTTTNDFAEANFVVLGNPNPPFLGAITNSFSYKGVGLTFTFQGVAGNKIQMAGDPYMAANAAWFDNQTVDQLKSWKEPGDITMIPQARLGYSNGDQGRSSRYISDGDYLKLRSAMLSYDLPSSIVSKMKISGLRVYLQGQNLLTFTNYIGWDPEVSSDFATDNITSGLDFYSAPQPRTVLVGLSISL